MKNSLSPNCKYLFDEMALANFGDYQIAIPTIARLAKRKFFSTWISVPTRIYAAFGWLIHDRQVVAHVKSLTIHPLDAQGVLSQAIQRLAVAIPISFQTEGTEPLPAEVSSQATFSYQLTDEAFPYQSVFRQVRPRFVRIYDFKQNTVLLERVEQMLTDEALFITQNYTHLKQVPFYQEQFNISAT